MKKQTARNLLLIIIFLINCCFSLTIDEIKDNAATMPFQEIINAKDTILHYEETLTDTQAITKWRALESIVQKRIDYLKAEWPSLLENDEQAHRTESQTLHQMRVKYENNGWRIFSGVAMISTGAISAIITIADANTKPPNGTGRWTESHTVYMLLSIGLIFGGTVTFTF